MFQGDNCKSAARIYELYNAFEADLPALATTLGFVLNAIPYIDFERIVVGWLTQGV